MADAIFEEPRLAEIYDPLDPDRSDLDAYLALAGEFGVASVLDVGCGTGTLACLLAKRGVKVVAIDPAAASLEVARRKPGADRVRWLHADATSLPPLQTDLATMTGNVAQVFRTGQEWAATLRAIHAALRPEGRLVFESRDPGKKAWLEWNREQTVTNVSGGSRSGAIPPSGAGGSRALTGDSALRCPGARQPGTAAGRASSLRTLRPPSRAPPPAGLTQPTGCHNVWRSDDCYPWRSVMPIPDRIERTIELAHPPVQVWDALTSAEGLGGWFGDRATVDLRPGGVAHVEWDNDDSCHKATLTIAVVEPPTRFAWTWGIQGLPDADPRRTYVEFTLVPTGAGTRLTVVETGFAQVPDGLLETAYQGNVEGWRKELAHLVSYLDAAA